MRPIFAILLCSLSTLGLGQVQASFSETLANLYTAAAIPDTSLRNSEIGRLWKAIKEAGIPMIKDDSVAFIYRGEAKTVTWMGDFNGWGFKREFNNKGRKIPGTDIWLLRCSFPRDARMDYKLQIDGVQSLDPENPFHQWSGVGGGSPNSELRMPDWKEDPILKPRAGISHGTVKKDILFTSKMLGYQVMYSVYLPAGHSHHTKLPVLYVTDGYEYMLPELGNIITVLDNLIADKKIEPIVVILVDHREPINRSNNRRMTELNMSEGYLKFFGDEFMPVIEAKYPILRDPAHRAILGNSMGGLTSAYFAFTRPDLFSMAGIQSGAFWAHPQIYSLCDNPNAPKIKVSMTSGTINDASDGSRKMKDILENNACVYHYRENNEGHSWGNWRSLIDDILIDFFGKQ